MENHSAVLPIVTDRIVPDIELALRCTPIVCPVPPRPEFPWAGIGTDTVAEFDLEPIDQIIQILIKICLA